MFRNIDTDLTTQYQTSQIPIFKKLVEQNKFLSDFHIVCNDQYIGVEKKYNIDNNIFWVNIEIEDAETIEEIKTYEVWFMRHENAWYPKNEYEEFESYPIKHSYFNNIRELQEMINALNRGNLEKANRMMQNN